MGMLGVTIAKQVDVEGWSVWTRELVLFSPERGSQSPSTQPWLALGQLPGWSFLLSPSDV